MWGYHHFLKGNVLDLIFATYFVKLEELLLTLLLRKAVILYSVALKGRNSGKFLSKNACLWGEPFSAPPFGNTSFYENCARHEAPKDKVDFCEATKFLRAKRKVLTLAGFGALNPNSHLFPFFRFWPILGHFWPFPENGLATSRNHE